MEKNDDIMYKELIYFHPACTAGVIFRRLIKSVFEIYYCLIEKMCAECW